MRSNPQETADLVTFTEKSLTENFIFLCSVYFGNLSNVKTKLFGNSNVWAIDKKVAVNNSIITIL